MVAFVLMRNVLIYIYKARDGPVQFEKDNGDDPFNVDRFLSEVGKESSKRGYGIQESDRASKRPRVDEDDE